MAWIYLIIAGALEVLWAYTMKQSHGFTRLWESIVTLIGMVGSVGLLGLAMRELPLGTSYMVWTGIGAVGTFIVGLVFLGEVVSTGRLLAAGLIVAGLVVMKLSSA